MLDYPKKQEKKEIWLCIKPYKPLFIVGVMICIALFMISSVSANIISEAHNVTFSGIPTSSDKIGVQILMKNNGNIINATKHASVNADRGYILNNSDGSILASGSFVGNVVDFGNYSVTVGTKYWVVVNKTSGAYTYLFGAPGFVEGTYLNWTRGGSYPEPADAGNLYNILSIYFENTTTEEPSPDIFINLTSPENKTTLSETGTNFTANFNITGTNSYNYTWKNATYQLWKSGTQFNFTSVALSGNNTNYSLYIDDFTLSGYVWNILGWYGNATFSNYTIASNYTFNVGATISNVTYNTEVYETSNQMFSGNLTLLEGTDLFDVKIVYNGTEYGGSLTKTNNDTYLVYGSLDIPTVTTTLNYSYYFKLIYSIGAGEFLYENTTSYNQTVNPISLYGCNSATNRTLNFTAQTEGNLTSLTTWNFLATFEYWVGSGNVRKNVSINNLSVSSASLCINPAGNLTYKTAAVIQYESTEYVKRNYYLYNASLTNSTQNITLYLLLTTDSTAFIISVKDGSQLPITDAYIYVQRYYPGTGLFQTVAMSRTDGNGNTVAHFEAETEDYRIIVMKDGVVIYTSPIQKVYCSATPCTLPIQTEAAGVSGWTKVGNLTNLVYSGPSYDSTTNLISYTYVDTSGTTNYGRLWVYTINSARGKETVIDAGTGLPCNITSTSNAATLICNVTGIQGTVYAEGYLSRSPEILVWGVSFIINTIKSIMGLEGLFWAMIVILVLAIAGVLMGGVAGGIVGTILGFVGTAWLGIASFGMITIWGLIIIGVFIIWQIKN